MKREFDAVLAAHFDTYPVLELQDVYKLIYQRVFGPEHLIDDVRAAKEGLYLEVVRLPETVLPSPEPLFEPLSAELCRVNLQPYVKSGGDLEALWRKFRQTARDFQSGTVVDLEWHWRLFLTSSWASAYPSAEQEQFWQRMATANFSPVHHSRTYATAYTPHYRVVLRSLLDVAP